MSPVKSPSERGLTAQRLIDVRKAAGFTNQKAAAAHVRAVTKVVGLTDSQWASYESGDPRRPFQAKHREAIESVFGPLNDEQQEAATSATDMAALVEQLRRQNDLLTEQNRINAELIAFLTASYTSEKAPTWFEVRGGGMTLGVQDAVETAIHKAEQRLLDAFGAGTHGHEAGDKTAQAAKGQAR